MAASDPANPSTQPAREDMLAELTSLRAQVDHLAAGGRELISTQTRMQSLLHRSTDAIIQFEADGTVSSFNTAAERLFDRPEIEILHRPADALFDLPDAFRGNVPHFLLDYVRDTPDQFARPLVGLRADGARVLLTVSVAEIAPRDLLLFDDFSDDDVDPVPGYEAFLCILRDITESKRVDRELHRYRENLEQIVAEQTREIRAARDEAERANRAKSAFLASMSHELRTPMHAILSYSELGRKKRGHVAPERLGQYFDRIQTAGMRLLAMINDLLDISKAEAGRQVYDMQPTDLEAAIRAILHEYGGLADKRRIAIDYRPGLADPVVTLDEEKMGQVVRNLLSNALKFSPESGRVSIETADAVSSRVAPDVTAVVITVRDQGPGIPEPELESVFEKFVQGSRNGRSMPGTGLGLAIAREVVKAHGGSISARNNDDRGSCFRVVLPRAGARKRPGSDGPADVPPAHRSVVR